MIRTTDELIDKIAHDLVWRRRELTDMRTLVQQSHGQLRERVLIRAAIALLYAHWEGFVKKSASHYLEFVASSRLPYKRLKSNFLGIALRARIGEAKSSNKASSGNAIADFLVNSIESQSRIPYKDVIDTKSNLSSKVLIDILDTLGLDHSQFSTRLTFIDSRLVNPRNHIAHGEGLFVDTEDYLEIHDSVISLIETFRNLVENSSVLRQFQIQPDQPVIPD